MAEVLLLGEDKTHAVLMGVLLRKVVQMAAVSASADWLLDGLELHVTLRGHEDLGEIVAGLRYTTTGQRFDVLGPNGQPIRLRPLRKADGTPSGPEVTRWRHVFLSVLQEPRPDAVLVAKDTDGKPDSVAGLRQVVDHLRKEFPSIPLVIAAPDQDAEGWLVAGFLPTSPEERERLDGLCRDLSIHPTHRPELLTAHPNDAPRDAKRVLRRLLDLGDESRPLDPDELRDHHERLLSDLPRLRQQGAETGLPGFLDDLHVHLVPLWLGEQRG